MDTWTQLLARHASLGILVDTNLLLLYGVGLHDKTFITRFKRTSSYTTEDFDLVLDIVTKFHRLITTPHILAELSNLAIDGSERRSRPYSATLVETLRASHELHVEKDAILAAETILQLGITDTGIIELARRDGYLVLTDDFPLAGWLQSYECSVINLNHLRTIRWFK